MLRVIISISLVVLALFSLECSWADADKKYFYNYETSPFSDFSSHRAEAGIIKNRLFYSLQLDFVLSEENKTVGTTVNDIDSKHIQASLNLFGWKYPAGKNGEFQISFGPSFMLSKNNTDARYLSGGTYYNANMDNDKKTYSILLGTRYDHKWEKVKLRYRVTIQPFFYFTQKFKIRDEQYLPSGREFSDNNTGGPLFENNLMIKFYDLLMLQIYDKYFKMDHYVYEAQSLSQTEHKFSYHHFEINLKVDMPYYLSFLKLGVGYRVRREKLSEGSELKESGAVIAIGIDKDFF